MKYWKYQELIDAIHEAFLDGLDQDLSVEDTIACISEDYNYYPENEHLVTNLITLMEVIKLGIEQLNYVLQKEIDRFETLVNLNSESVLLQGLEHSEIDLIKKSIKEVREKVKTVPIINS